MSARCFGFKKAPTRAGNISYERRIRTRNEKNRHGKTINKHIRVEENHWKRIGKTAHERGITPSRLMLPAAREAIKRKKWPCTKAEIHLLRPAVFAAQTIVHDSEKVGREEEIH